MGEAQDDGSQAPRRRGRHGLLAPPLHQAEIPPDRVSAERGVLGQRPSAALPVDRDAADENIEPDPAEERFEDLGQGLGEPAGRIHDHVGARAGELPQVAGTAAVAAQEPDPGRQPVGTVSAVEGQDFGPGGQQGMADLRAEQPGTAQDESPAGHAEVSWPAGASCRTSSPGSRR